LVLFVDITLHCGVWTLTVLRREKVVFTLN
jgi:hypothetical protein